MGQEQSAGRGAPPILLGQTPFCFTAAVGDTLHVVTPGETAAPEPAPSEPPTGDAGNAFKKKSRFGSALSMAKKGAALAAKGAKAGAKMLLGSTLRPRLVPQSEATRACFLCLCGTRPEDSGKAAAYGVPCYLRANVSGGAVLREGSGHMASTGRYVFSGTELEGALPVIIVSCTGKAPGTAIMIGDQFLMLADGGSQAFIFASAADGGIELQTLKRDEVQSGAAAMFVAASVPAELTAPKQAQTSADGGNGSALSTGSVRSPGISDTSLFAGLLGSMAVAGAVGGQVAQDKVVKDFATARYTGDNGLTKAMGDLSMARSLSQSGPGRFLVNMVVNQGVSMAIGSATAGGRKK